MAHAAFRQHATARILVGDDQTEIQDALSLLLRGAGYQVHAASSPAEILKCLDENSYDLLLMDLNYRRDTTSGKEGLEVLRAIRSGKSATPVVVMTAWGSIDLAVEAMHLGARDFIQKPWENAHLLHLVEKHVDAARTENSTELRRSRERQEAAEVQRRLLPSKMPSVPGVDLAGGYWPADEIAGDYFDVFQLGESIAVCIADVIGKGLPAALLMSNLQAAVKVTASDTIAPAELCRRINHLCCGNNASGKFISFFYGVLNPTDGSFRYCNAGHLPPIHVAHDRTSALTVDDAVLGLSPDWQFHDRGMQLSRGDRLLLYTDGLSEAADEEGNEFGEERIRDALVAAAPARGSQVLDRIVADASSHCGGQFADDVTCLLLSLD
jgi:sigma-B regulation protein RsbU (phosphoserine phosphatase)